MKTRAGFVSNSSSSSFIIGYGIVTDVGAFKSYCKKNKIEFVQVDPQMENWYSDVELFEQMVPHDCREVYGGNDTSITIPSEVADNPKGNILRVTIGNNEGDGLFWDEESGDMRYEMANDPDFFDGWQRAVIDMFDENFIKDGCVYFGAERNG